MSRAEFETDIQSVQLPSWEVTKAETLIIEQNPPDSTVEEKIGVALSQ
jgi:hypothetical protein